jgi:hypothetical protein
MRARPAGELVTAVHEVYRCDASVARGIWVVKLRSIQCVDHAPSCAALKTGPVSHGDRGSKVSPEWQAWSIANGRYTVLLDKFGLTPMSARQVPMLPQARGAQLAEVA